MSFGKTCADMSHFPSTAVLDVDTQTLHKFEDRCLDGIGAKCASNLFTQSCMDLPSAEGIFCSSAPGPASRISQLKPTSHRKHRIRSRQMTCDKESSPQDMVSCLSARQRTPSILASRRKLVKQARLLSCAMPSHPFRQPVRKQHN